jgi:hypothetical protein
MTYFHPSMKFLMKTQVIVSPQDYKHLDEIDCRKQRSERHFARRIAKAGDTPISQTPRSANRYKSVKVCRRVIPRALRI